MIDNPPDLDDEMYKAAIDAKYEADPDGLWVTDVLVCAECESFHVAALAGAMRDIARDGLPVPKTCFECQTKRRHYEIDGLRRRQRT